MEFTLKIIAGIVITFVVISALRLLYKSFAMKAFSEMAQMALYESARAQQIKRQEEQLLKQQELAERLLKFQEQRTRNKQERTLKEQQREQEEIKRHTTWYAYYEPPESDKCASIFKPAENIKPTAIKDKKPSPTDKLTLVDEEQNYLSAQKHVNN